MLMIHSQLSFYNWVPPKETSSDVVQTSFLVFHDVLKDNLGFWFKKLTFGEQGKQKNQVRIARQRKVLKESIQAKAEGVSLCNIEVAKLVAVFPFL